MARFSTNLLDRENSSKLVMKLLIGYNKKKCTSSSVLYILHYIIITLYINVIIIEVSVVYIKDCILIYLTHITPGVQLKHALERYIINNNQLDFALQKYS